MHLFYKSVSCYKRSTVYFLVWSANQSTNIYDAPHKQLLELQNNTSDPGQAPNQSIKIESIYVHMYVDRKSLCTTICHV